MKYTFEKIDNDTTKLSYKDKEFTIKRDVDLLRKLQGIYMKARTKMMLDLSKEGLTKKDLIIEKKENGKTLIDNSNAKEIEEAYVQMMALELYNDISKSNTGMDITELMMDIGLFEAEEQEQFGKEFSMALQGDVKTPSKEK